MDRVLQIFTAVFDFKMFIIIVIFTEILARAGMGEAFRFKKNKSRLKKDNKQRSRICKIFGLYHFSMTTHAPHHLKKYAVIRICNLISLVLTPPTYFLIPYMSELQIVFYVLVALHALFLLALPIADCLILSNIKEYGKMLDFDKSRKP